jgi:hypothetical protein
MEDELRKAKAGGTAQAGADVAHKKELAQMKSKYEKDAVAQNKKVEIIERKLKAATDGNSESKANSVQLETDLKNAVRENKELNVKVEKFAQAAGEAA